jgi:energy-coupling factor transport system permease protein
MLASFSYHPRSSLIEQIDPRARWIFSFAMLFSIVLFWDLRFLVFFFCLAMAQFFMTRLTWGETRRAWIVIFILTSMMIFANTILTGSGTIGSVMSGGVPLFYWNVNILQFNIHYVLTISRAWFALAQFLRVISIAAIFLVIPFTMNPSIYGATFRGLGFTDKLAYTMDLSFRFIPTLTRDFAITIDAQRARGFEMDKVKGGLFERIKKIAPLIIPVTMNAILSGEDIVNAMDLRCFGLQARTWVTNLVYQKRDFIVIGGSILILLASLFVRLVIGVGDFWMPA